MQPQVFKSYLRNEYRGRSGSGLSSGAAVDVCSRYIRVEKVQQINLDAYLSGDAKSLYLLLRRFEQRLSEFNFKTRSAKYPVRSALHTYNKFVESTRNT